MLNFRDPKIWLIYFLTKTPQTLKFLWQIVGFVRHQRQIYTIGAYVRRNETKSYFHVALLVLKSSCFLAFPIVQCVKVRQPD